MAKVIELDKSIDEKALYDFHARDEVLLLLLLDLIRPLESAPTVVLVESPASALWVCVAIDLTPSVVSCLSLLLLYWLAVVPGQ